MAMTVVIQELTGAGPTSTTVTSVTFNRVDTINGTTPIPVPTTLTNFSWVKTFILNITATGALTMTNILFGKRTNEATGLQYWARTDEAVGAYTQAVATPAATSVGVGPDINGSIGIAVDLITVPPAAYSAGPHTTTGQKGNIVEVVVGVISTVANTGSAVPLPNMTWQWTEA